MLLLPPVRGPQLTTAPATPWPLQSLWTTTISMALPLPFKHAVAAQAVAVGAMLASLGYAHRVSTELCALSDARHGALAGALSFLPAAALPPPLGGAALAWARGRLRSGRAAFHAVNVFLLGVSYCGFLTLRYRSDLRWRRMFARERRLPVGRALLQRHSLAAGALPLGLLVGSLLWLGACWAAGAAA